MAQGHSATVAKRMLGRESQCGRLADHLFRMSRPRRQPGVHVQHEKEADLSSDKQFVPGREQRPQGDIHESVQ